MSRKVTSNDDGVNLPVHIIAYQDAQGMWHQLLDKPDSYPETSCTAMFVIAIARGVNRGWRDMMVCPVTVKNALSRPVYFPGGDWLVFWMGERISGRQYKSFLTPIEIMPIFLRRGAIIPRQEAMQYVGERPNTNISLLIYPSEHSVYEMYEDDSKSLDYQQGVYAITKMESRLAQNEWALNITTPKGSYKPISHYYSVSVYLKKPKLVTVAGKFVDGWKYDEALRCLTFNAGEGDMEIVVKM